MALDGRRIGMIAVTALVVLLVYAWVDGGEEPLRPIVQPIAVPEPVE